MPQTTGKVKDPALDLPLSGWWRRFGSGVVDTVISWGLTIALVAIAAPSYLARWWSLYLDYSVQLQQALASGQIVTPGKPLATATSYLVLALGGVTAVYCIVFLGMWGATLGHKLMGIKVIKAPLPPALLQLQPNTSFTQEKPGWLRSISKGLGWALFSNGGQLFTLVQLVNVLLPLWHKRKQSVTDLFASTLVIRDTKTKKDI